MPDDGLNLALGTNSGVADSDMLMDRLAVTYRELSERGALIAEAVSRVPAVCEDDDTASKIGDFIVQMNALVKAAESKRTDEKEPYLNGGRLVDAFFKRMTDPVLKAKKDIESRLTIYHRRKAEEEERRRREAARLAAEEAERARKEAAEKAAALQSEADLQAAVEAETRASQATADASKAARAADAKPADLSRTRGDLGSVSSLRTTWEFDKLDRAQIDLELLRPYLPQDGIEKAVRAFIRAGGRQLRGVNIFEHTTAVVR